MTDRERALLEADDAVRKVENSCQFIRLRDGSMDPDEFHRWHVNVTRALRAVMRGIRASGDGAQAQVPPERPLTLEMVEQVARWHFSGMLPSDERAELEVDVFMRRLRQQMGGGQG